MAAVMTLGIFVALTFYAFTTKKDFTMIGGFLACCCMVMLLLCIFLMFTNNKVLHTIYCGLGVLLFSVYILYDT